MYKATGTITEVGKVKNTIAYEPTRFIFNPNNYDIQKDEGDLVITPNTSEIIVTAANGHRLYDGTELINPTFTTKGLPTGFTVDATVKGSVTDVREGAKDNIVTSVVIRDGSGKDVTNGFANIRTVNGSLYVEARDVKLISQSDTKVYDGTELTAPDVTVEGDGLLQVRLQGSKRQEASQRSETQKIPSNIRRAHCSRIATTESRLRKELC